MNAILLDSEGAWISECVIDKNSLLRDPQKLRPAGNDDYFKLPVICQGFYDSHIHPSFMAKHKSQVNCRKKTLLELCDEIKGYPGDVVYGFGWDEASLKASEEEMCEELSQIDKKIYLFRICGHVAYVSKQGFLKEAELKNIPESPLREEALNAVISELNTSGIDEWADLLVHKNDFQILFQHKALLFGDVNDLSYFATTPKKPHYIKYFLDGSLGARTAWLSQNYSDANSFGFPQWGDSALFESIKASLSAGFLVAFHAIGDAALDQLLSISKKLLHELKNNLKENFLHRIEHLQVCRDDQIEEIKKQGIWSLGLQPSHRVADESFILSRLGEKRLQLQAYRLKSFLDAEIPISFGSDAPIVSFNPHKNFDAILGDTRSTERISLEKIYKIYCVEGRQNAGITAKKLHKKSKLYISQPFQ